MKLVLRTLVLGLSMLTSVGLLAQEMVNLVAITEINITLDANCEAVVQLDQVLTGDFDADGNGTEADPSAFTISVVENGQVVGDATLNGCGVYTIQVTADPALVSGFTTGWSTVNAEDKTGPSFTTLPTQPAGPLYCDRLEAISLNGLPNGVSRCYTYNTFTASIVDGTLDDALRARLEAGGGVAIASDACSELVEICVNEIITRDPARPTCEDVTLTWTFTATDGSCPNNSSEPNPIATEEYVITFTRPDLNDLQTGNVADDVKFTCAELEAAGIAFGDVPPPAPESLPFFNGPNGERIVLPLGTDSDFCGFGITFEDGPPIFKCERAYKVLRTYRIIDWCNTADSRLLSQFLEIGDVTPPSITLPSTGVLTFPTNVGNECGAVIRLDMGGITVADACGSDFTVTAQIFSGNTDTGTPIGSYVLDFDNATAETSDVLGLGDYLIRYTLQDECSNSTSENVLVRVVDETAPVAICEDGLIVSLSSSTSPDPTASAGLAVLNPRMIDNGSYDDCSADLTLEIARVRQLADGAYELLPDASYGQTIIVDCSDLDAAVTVGLRVRDELGQENFCWMEVTVEDKTAPTCNAPADMTISCRQFETASLPTDIATASEAELNREFGVPFSTDNCVATTAQAIAGSLNSCGVGTFTRTFTVSDGTVAGAATVCEQQIRIIGYHDYVISFPGDTHTFCGFDPRVATLEVEEEGNCDLIAVTENRDTFNTEVDACFKVRIEYEVINWCEYNGVGEPYVIPRDYDGDNNLGERTFLYIRPIDETTLTDDIAYLDSDETFGNNNFSLILDDDSRPYAVDDSRGAFRYTQFIKVSDEEAPEIVVDDVDACFGATNPNCTGSVNLGFEVSDNCTDVEDLRVTIELDEGYVAANGFGRTRFLTDGEFSFDAEGNYSVEMQNIQIGDHALRVRLSDGCGNSDLRIISFCMRDSLAPAPICILQTSIALGEDGNGAYWATDALASPTADCSGEVTYSIYKLAETQASDFVLAPGRDGIEFTCDDDATTQVRLYAFDPAGQSSFCTVLVLVQRAENACSDVSTLASLSGGITTSKGSAVPDVRVALSGAGNSEETTTTDASGSYSFDRLRITEDYTIDPNLNSYINHGQGVSTFDLVLMTRYILGTDVFKAPYQHIAADANNSGDISVQDIIAISRLILGLDTEYPNQDAWVFVEADFVFPVANNPWATRFPEVINYNNLSGDIRGADFIAIMVGDVSGNSPGLQEEDGSRPRSGGAVMTAEDRLLEAGKHYDIAINAGDLGAVMGVQGTFAVTSDADIISITEAAFKAGNYNPNMLERGVLPFSYTANHPLEQQATLITLTLRANRTVPLREVLTINDAVLVAESYPTTEALSTLQLDFTNTEDFAEGDLLMQNVPNPVGDLTTIAFRLAKAGPATLTVRNIAGQVVLERSVTANKGLNQLRFHRDELAGRGVFTYTLASEGFTASRKLVVQ